MVYSLAGKFTAADIAKDVAPVGKRTGGQVRRRQVPENTDLEKILKDKGIQDRHRYRHRRPTAPCSTPRSGAALRGLNVIVPVDGISSARIIYAEQFTAWQLAQRAGASANR